MKLIIGSQALNDGAVTEYELRRWHARMYRDIYLPKPHAPDLAARTEGAWLRSGRRGVIAGVAASAVLGAEWVDDDVPIELIWDNTRPPRGIIARAERVRDDETTTRAGITVTTPARTAYDLGRHLERGDALARLDALQRAAPFSADDVVTLMARYKGARGTRQLRELLSLVDAGAASPPETRLRLLFLDAGFPRPATQLPVYDQGRILRTLDMGWDEFLVAAEYDGDQHRTNRLQYVKDQRLMPKVQRLGWDVVRAIKEDRAANILDRGYLALVGRGWDGRLDPHRRIRWWQPPKALGNAAGI